MSRTPPHSGKSKGSTAAAAVVDAVIANPTAVAGAVVMSAMAAAILTNALTMQPGQHPAPLFHGVRPLSPPDGDAARPRARDAAAAAYDRSLVMAIQEELSARGYYDGAIDGLSGPKTSAAITAFQKDSGLSPLGEPTSDVLAVLKRSRPVPPPAPVSETQPPATVSEPATLLAAVPLPRPRPGLAIAPEAGAGRVPMPDETIQTAAVAPAGTVAPEADLEDPLSALIGAAPPPRPPAEAIVEAPGVAPAGPVPEPIAARDGETVVVPQIVTVQTEPQPVVQAPRGDPRLARIQDALDRLGYGPLGIDGLMNPQTREAIRRFETNRSLPVTGEITEAFLFELMKIGGLTP